MPRYSVQVPVTILISFTVDAPDESAAISTDFDGLDREPVFLSSEGIVAGHDDFRVDWMGSDAYHWYKASAAPADRSTTLFVDYEGAIYPDAATRDAALAADNDPDTDND